MSFQSSLCASASAKYGNATSTPDGYEEDGLSTSTEKPFTGIATSRTSVTVQTGNLLTGMVASPTVTEGSVAATSSNAASARSSVTMTILQLMGAVTLSSMLIVAW